jgi:signal transduction histidine kinase
MKHDYDIIPIPVSIRRSDGRYAYVNGAWKDMFSVDAENAIGKTDIDLRLDPLALSEGGLESAAGELAFRDVYITTRDRGRLLLELIETRVVDGDEEGILCVHQDMTGIGWRMEDLSRGLTRCEQRVRQNMQHFVRLSREMCEPLEQMAQYCDKLADEGKLSREQMGWLSTVRTNVNLLEKQIRRSVDLTLLGSAAELSEEEEIRISSLLDEVRELYRGLAAERGVSLETYVGQDLPGAVVVDHVRARQILVNLVDGALRTANGGTVRISASTVPGSDRPLCLKVRVENPHEENGSGPAVSMGGLQHRIVRGLCGMIGGRFEISRDPDGAAVFKVYLHVSPPKSGRKESGK